MMKKTTLFTFIFLCATALVGFTNLTKDSYQLDVGHTYIGFDVERFLVGEVSGRFNDFSASIEMEGDNFTTLQLTATVQVASIDSNNKTRDGHLKAPIWLDEKNHPEIKFTSTSVEKSGEGYTMKGDFTIKGTTKQVEFPVIFKGPFVDPTGSNTLGIQADFTINRFDYGINLSKKLKDGSYFIGEDVKIKIRALAIKK
jgi:polyisoprenoid-binding protein YceI